MNIDDANMLDQLDPIEVAAAATLCGCNQPDGSASPAFRNRLRSLPTFCRPYTLGEVARAYLRAALEELESMASERESAVADDAKSAA